MCRSTLVRPTNVQNTWCLSSTYISTYVDGKASSTRFFNVDVVTPDFGRAGLTGVCCLDFAASDDGIIDVAAVFTISPNFLQSVPALPPADAADDADGNGELPTLAPPAPVPLLAPRPPLPLLAAKLAPTPATEDDVINGDPGPAGAICAPPCRRLPSIVSMEEFEGWMGVPSAYTGKQ